MTATDLRATPPDTTDHRRWSLRTSFWLVIAAQVLLFAGSNFPTPLFPTYEARYGFGSGVVTLLFGIYVAVLIPTLLVLGRAADRIGRRPLIASGIAITILSSLAFAFARNVAWLFAGEVIYGIGAGMVMSCVSVTIRELHPRQHVAGGALAASVAAAGGLTLGPLVSGLLASATPWPTVSPYALDVALATVLAVALLRIPETRPTQPSAERPRLLHVPADIRPAFVATALAGAAGWMVFGWTFGLSPSYLHEQLHVHITRPVVGGLFAALVVFVSGVAQLALRRRHSLRDLHLSLGAMVVGLGLIAGSTVTDSLALAVVGAVVAGVGAGVAQMNAMATVQRIAPVHARAGVTSAYLVMGYLAMSVPVIVAGEAADRFGLGVVTAWFLVGLAVLAGTAAVLSRRSIVEPAADAPAAVDPQPMVEPDPAELAELAATA